MYGIDFIQWYKYVYYIITDIQKHLPGLQLFYLFVLRVVVRTLLCGSICTFNKNMVKAPVGRPRFLRYLYVTLILFSIHIPLFTVIWYMQSSNASCGSVKSAVNAPNFFKILYLAIAKSTTSFLTKHFFRKLHLMPIRVLLSPFCSFLACLLLVISSNRMHRHCMHRMHFTWTLTCPPQPHVCNVASTPYALHMNVNMPPHPMYAT